MGLLLGANVRSRAEEPRLILFDGEECVAESPGRTHVTETFELDVLLTHKVSGDEVFDVLRVGGISIYVIAQSRRFIRCHG